MLSVAPPVRTRLPAGPTAAVIPPTAASLIAVTTSPTVSALLRSTVLVTEPFPSTNGPGRTPLFVAPRRSASRVAAVRPGVRSAVPVTRVLVAPNTSAPSTMNDRFEFSSTRLASVVDDPTNVTPPLSGDERRVGRPVPAEQVGAAERLVPERDRLLVQALDHGRRRLAGVLGHVGAGVGRRDRLGLLEQPGQVAEGRVDLGQLAGGGPDVLGVRGPLLERLLELDGRGRVAGIVARPVQPLPGRQLVLHGRQLPLRPRHLRRDHVGPHQIAYAGDVEREDGHRR
jgi:hypothetical protein